MLAWLQSEQMASLVLVSQLDRRKKVILSTGGHCGTCSCANKSLEIHTVSIYKKVIDVHCEVVWMAFAVMATQTHHCGIRWPWIDLFSFQAGLQIEGIEKQVLL